MDDIMDTMLRQFKVAIEIYKINLNGRNASISELHTETGLSNDIIKREINRLFDWGIIKIDDKGYYISESSCEVIGRLYELYRR